ncbi:MAG TPA: aldo/keto reductase [Caulobacteraceae bacterium]|jgi:aryl-alcohol dehydrogenase-like predicted oxidoreductase|nr:aldo/keto reductase [Caulobacteraceae bacterium]
MRFRPLGKSGMVVSTISLSLSDRAAVARPSDWVTLIYTAFENGINSFEVHGDAPALIDGLAQAMRAVERRLVYIAWRVGTRLGPGGVVMRDFSAGALCRMVDGVLARSGVGYLDAVVLDDPQTQEFSPQALDQLKLMRADGRARMLGVAGQDDALDALLTTGAFDVLYLPYSLTSGWAERRRLKAAVERDMGVIGYDYYPKTFYGAAGAAPKQGGWSRLKPTAPPQQTRSNDPLAGAGTYAFLNRTRNWTPEEICLAHALTEPSLSSVQVTAERSDRIEAMAAIPDREMPPGVSAQIEMARFSAVIADRKGRSA